MPPEIFLKICPRYTIPNFWKKSDMYVYVFVYKKLDIRMPKKYSLESRYTLGYPL